MFISFKIKKFKMKHFYKIVLILLQLILNGKINSQDTFSICAVDPVTGQVGSAGASCVNDCTILTDVFPGWGVVHTQASWLSANQNYAHSLMLLHLSPLAIIDSLILHDAQNNPSIRQYGIVDLSGGGRRAAYTGVNCLNYKNHITGPTYSIQGNILLGQQILDSMHSRFLNTSGNLASKLMAALQGAKVVGADSRCASWNTSSKSAFIRVAKPGDTLGVLYLNLKVLNTPFGRDPIDSLQVLYNNWVTSVPNQNAGIPASFYLSQNYPNPFNPVTTIDYQCAAPGYVTLKIYSLTGNEIEILVNENKFAGNHIIRFDGSKYPSGVYYYKIEIMQNNGDKFSQTKRMVLLK